MSTISQSHHNLFDKARDLAEFGEHRVRVGCVIARKGKPFVGTFNTIRNGEVESLGDQYFRHTYHAEANAIKLLQYEHVKTGGLTMLVCRLDRAGELKPSRPCHRCIRTIKNQGAISRIVFWNGEMLQMMYL